MFLNLIGFCCGGGRSYIMASYAHFLWDAEGDDEDEEELKDRNDANKGSQPRNISWGINGGAPPSVPPPIAGAS